MLAKICGVKSVDAAKHAAQQGADFVGIILVPNRKRTIPHAVAKEISAYLRSLPADRPKLVGVFRNQSLEEIARLQAELELDVVQLHGSEPFSMIEKIRGPVIRRISPDSPSFIEEVVKTSDTENTWALVDSEQGGDGKTVDWSMLSKIGKAGGSYILAGGLTPENVKDALAHQGCVGVDVSGGVEKANGEKDFDKITRFLVAVKNRS